MTDSLLNPKGHVRGLVVVLLIVVALAGTAAWWRPGFWRTGFDHADWTRQARKLAIEVTSTVDGEWRLAEGIYRNDPPKYPFMYGTENDIEYRTSSGWARGRLVDSDDPGRDLQLVIDRLVELGFPLDCHSSPTNRYPFGAHRLHAGDNLTTIRVYMTESDVFLEISYVADGIGRPPLVCVR